MGSVMIDRINNQKYYEYSKVNQQKRETTESSEFNLNLGKEGVIYEKSEQKKSSKAKQAEPAENDAKSSSTQGVQGVNLQMSTKGMERTGEEKKQTSWMEQVKRYAVVAVDFLKAVWDKIWNDHTPSQEEFPEVLEKKMEGTQAIHGTEEAVSPTGIMAAEKRHTSTVAERPEYTQEDIRRMFQRGNRREIEDFLSDYGQKRLARNTELLTQYDRSGSLVGISQSDKELILYGDKSRTL